MELDFTVRDYIESSLSGIDLKSIKKVTNNIIEGYLSNDNQGHFYIKNELEAKLYASFRMPATYKAVSQCLYYIKELYKQDIHSLVDIGAGSGSATLASMSMYDLKEITCYENNVFMMNLGKEITTKFIDKSINWIKADITKDNISTHGDLLISSYVLNELNEIDREEVIKKLWSLTDKVILFVEPGTPKGFLIIKSIRETLLKLGGYIIAPCPKMEACPMKEDDWCHFSTRVMRSKFHKLLKEGNVPYEDEKYSYIAFCKTKSVQASSRVIRHPIILPSLVKLTVCKDGIEEIEIRKSNKGLFKKARKINSGDNF